MMTASLPKGYRPSEKELFMNRHQIEYFRSKLQAWREDLLQDSSKTLHNLKQEVPLGIDSIDRANLETDRNLELRSRDRERKLLIKIDQALDRISRGTYGYCQITGQPIGLRRLEARPVATLSAEAQEMHETKEKSHT